MGEAPYHHYMAEPSSLCFTQRNRRSVVITATSIGPPQAGIFLENLYALMVDKIEEYTQSIASRIGTSPGGKRNSSASKLINSSCVPVHLPESMIFFRTTPSMPQRSLSVTLGHPQNIGKPNGRALGCSGFSQSRPIHNS